MMSKQLVQLGRCNSKLKKRSWEIYQEWLQKMLSSIDHDKARKLLEFLNARDYTGLVMEADSISSAEYRTAAEHRLLNQLSAVIRKYPFPKGSVKFDPRGKAMEIFLRAERVCARHNERFRLFDVLRSPHESALQSASSWIKYVLGDVSLKEVWDNCDFGAGASIGIHGNATNSARKLLAKDWTVSPSAFYYAGASLMQDNLLWELLNSFPGRPHYSHDTELFWNRFKEKVSFIEHNKISFVPKTAKVERTIAVEPLLNGYVQKGVDQLMRKKLKRVGIDLNDQTRNQRLAKAGSLNGSDAYVTIDLSSASDSISIGLCKRLLPPEWFDLLDSLRSRYYKLESPVLHRYHKFASMGNGFCFPLETLIFASVCEVAYRESSLPSDYSVYGDDIIVRQCVADRVLFLLKAFGFTHNRDKTFLSGPFRESCGADWFEGEDVRPINLDFAFDSVENIFKFCNSCRTKDTWECIFGEANDYLVSLIPRGLLFTRPFSGNVDTALEVPWDVFMASPYSRYSRKTSSWSWVEILKSAWPDNPVRHFTGYNVALMRGALSGSMSSVPFAERRKSRTKLRRTSHSGSTSLFVPTIGDSSWNASAVPLSGFRSGA